MKVVVADTSPLNYLVLIGEVGVLPGLYGTVVIPTAVFMELSASDAPVTVREWTRELPSWIEIRSPSVYPDVPSLMSLDPGERAAVQLAKAETEALLVMDDAAGRREAKRLGLPTIGTLGLLRLAAVEQLIDLRPALDRLMRTNFRAPTLLIRDLIAEDANRSRALGRSAGDGE